MQQLSEFAIIDRYFKQQTTSRSDVVLGIGDDAALLQMPPSQLLVAAVDTLVAGVHFPLQTSPSDIAYKALAVNLSDLAAMGAMPAWFTLALTMPESNPVWLENFASGLFKLASQYQMQLIGGDTTRGPLSVTIQVHGFVPPQQALLRSGARPGDLIYVSGTLGDAGLGLRAATGQCDLPQPARDYVLQRLNRPTPQVELGLLLRDYASSAIDISDGLLADLQHILDESGTGAEVHAGQLPISKVLGESVPREEAVRLALSAGDDYELCFTVPPGKENAMLEALKKINIKCSRIGLVTRGSGLDLKEFSEKISTGYKHF